MSNPAVVILTDPARCQLAEAETLVQALLQVQQLNEAGVPASQTFCDHPAAAMEFIEAYSKAYPALQLETSDLPLPQHLHSMVADGRLSPLRPVEAVETAKPEQSGQLYPLYVLSLGAPEALIQALQHNSLAKSSIRVLEIAPIEHANAEPVSVAEAVAAAPLARSSWLPESSRVPERGDEDAPGTGSLTENQVELSNVEDDLDRIQIDSVRDRQPHDRNDQVHYAPAFITTTAGPEPSASSLSWQSTAEATASSSGIPEPEGQPAGPAAPPPEPVSDTHLALTTELSDTSVAQSDVPPVVAESPSEDSAEAPEEPAQNDMEPSEPPSSDSGKQEPTTGPDASTRSAPESAQTASDVDDAAAASPSEPPSSDSGEQELTTSPDASTRSAPESAQTASDVDDAAAASPSEPPSSDSGEQELTTSPDASTRSAPESAQTESDVDDAAAASSSSPEGDDESSLAGHTCVFALLGEDVLYQPTGSFSGNDDLAYALPTSDAAEPDPFTALFDFSATAEVIDLDAMYRDLWESADGRAALEGFDCILMRAPNSARADPNDAPAAYSGCERSVEQRTPEPDEDEAATNPLTTVHDADV
jgi:hypothetical protein